MGGGSFEICSCCGFQFGVSDDDRGYTFERWRLRWVNQGLPWTDQDRPPPKDWDPYTQLARIGVTWARRDGGDEE